MLRVRGLMPGAQAMISYRSSPYRLFKQRIASLIGWLSLFLFLLITADLFLHPFAVNPITNDAGLGDTGRLLFRWASWLEGLFTILIALLIIRRAPGNLIGHLLLYLGVGSAGWSLRLDFGSPTLSSAVYYAFNIYYFGLAFPSLMLMLLIFPDGQPYPRRLRWPAFILVALFAGVSLLGDLATPLRPALREVGIRSLIDAPGLGSALFAGYSLVILPLITLATVSLVLRYRAARARTQQQIKWLAFFAAIAVLLTLVGAAFPRDANQWYISAFWFASYLYAEAIAPIGIGIAILRTRLWDIDIIIRRTLIYGALTGLLALFYFGCVVVLQQVFVGLTGQRSDLAIIISTLVIAGLFNPLRRRVQELIDRRFYRKKVDSARVLATFAATVRDEVDLERLGDELLSVVEETVQPECSNLWLMPHTED